MTDHPRAGKHVFIVTYACQLKPGQAAQDPVLSDEQQRIGLFTPDEIAGLVMPQGYNVSIATWLTQYARAAAGSRQEGDRMGRRCQ